MGSLEEVGTNTQSIPLDFSFSWLELFRTHGLSAGHGHLGWPPSRNTAYDRFWRKRPYLDTCFDWQLSLKTRRRWPWVRRLRNQTPRLRQEARQPESGGRPLLLWTTPTLLNNNSGTLNKSWAEWTSLVLLTVLSASQALPVPLAGLVDEDRKAGWVKRDREASWDRPDLLESEASWDLLATKELRARKAMRARQACRDPRETPGSPSPLLTSSSLLHPWRWTRARLPRCSAPPAVTLRPRCCGPESTARFLQGGHRCLVASWRFAGPGWMTPGCTSARLRTSWEGHGNRSNWLSTVSTSLLWTSAWSQNLHRSVE